MRFSFPHSHAFPGGRVSVDDEDEAEGPCEIEFSDGVTVIGNWQRDDDAIRLDVPTYRTARDTEVHARRWRLTCDKAGVWHSHRIG